MTASPSRPPSDTPANDTIDISHLLQVLWGYRRVIVGGTLGVLALYAVFLLVVYSLSPVRQAATLAFRLQFNNDRYPNDILFDQADILAVPVLEEVFESNQFDRYGDFQRFRNALMVTRASVDLEMLATEYRAKLSETRLTAAERARLEAEYAKQREALILKPSFALTLSWQSRTKRLPPALMDKVLNDVLTVWARQAANRKGVLRSKLLLFSPDEVRRDLARETGEPLIVLDLLRARGLRLRDSLRSLRAIPGSASARTLAGLSAADVSARLDDALNLDIAPRFAQFVAEGCFRSRTTVVGHFSTRAAAAAAAEAESKTRVEALRRSLRAYDVESAPGPDMSAERGSEPAARADSPAGNAVPFLESLLQLSTRNQDARFRRNMVDMMVREMDQHALLQALSGSYAATLKEIEARPAGRAPRAADLEATETAAKVMEAIARDLQTLSTQLIDLNLPGPAALYSVVEPFRAAQSDGLATLRPRVFTLGLVAASLVLLPIGCLLHSSMSKRQEPGA